MPKDEHSHALGEPQDGLQAAVANGIIQQLNALGAHDRGYAQMVARLMIENILHWQLTHGGDASAVAEYLQEMADTVILSKSLAP